MTILALLLAGMLFVLVQAIAFVTGFCASWVVGGVVGTWIKYWNKSPPDKRLKTAAVSWFVFGLALMIFGALLLSGFWAAFIVFAGAGWLTAIMAVWWYYIAN